MTAPHEIAACQPRSGLTENQDTLAPLRHNEFLTGCSAARTLCVPAYLKWRQRCVQSLSKPTVRGGMPDSLADYPAGSGGKALALGWVRKTGLGDLVVQLGKRGAAAASSSTPSWQAIKQAAPSVQQRRSPMHGWGIFAMEDIGSTKA